MASNVSGAFLCFICGKVDNDPLVYLEFDIDPGDYTTDLACHAACFQDLLHPAIVVGLTIPLINPPTGACCFCGSPTRLVSTYYPADPVAIALSYDGHLDALDEDDTQELGSHLSCLRKQPFANLLGIERKGFPWLF